MKKAAVINDLSGISRCSLTVAIGILTKLKIETCPLPTAILSTHSEYEEFEFVDFTSHMKPFIESWKKVSYKFDAIYSGFLGSSEQVDIIIDFAKYFKEDNTIFVVDPVMGDGGSLYSIYKEDYPVHMKELIQYADVITPNLTEFSLLSGYDMEWGFNIDKIKEYAKKLASEGQCKQIIITGVQDSKCNNKNALFNVVIDVKTDEVYVKEVEFSGKSYSGTGDLFASIVTGYLVNGYRLQKAVDIASDFISKVAKYTNQYDRDTREGIMYELFLEELSL